MDSLSRQDRVAGAVVGSAVGDALGAPFEFGPAGVYTARFPDGAGTMCGGGGWDYGFGAIPSRWSGPLHVPLPGYGDRVLRTPDLVEPAGRLDAHRADRAPADVPLP